MWSQIRAPSLFLVLCFSLCNVISGQTRINLNGIWTIQAEGDHISYPATVPGGVYMALYRKGVIKNPYAGFNDVAYREIGKKNWNFTRTFKVSNSTLQSKKIILVCEGIDTVAQVYINGQHVTKTSNMFVRYVIDVKKYVSAGTNSITVAFTSPVTAAQEANNELNYVIPPECPNFKQNGECHINLLRKTQASFSWDWGPAFPTQSIWRDIYIDYFNTSVIRDITTKTYKEKDVWNLEVVVFFDKRAGTPIKGQLSIHINELKVMLTTSVDLADDSNQLKSILKIPKESVVKPWWPHGYGSPYLYTLDVIYASKNDIDPSARQLRIGFRTVELVQHPVSKRPHEGLTFYFKINGLPVFFKGSNWIPADSFQERVTPKRIRNILQSLIDANQNSIRVWGGGVYESDEFYQIADELGVMIWHDFMFAVALYPATPEFLTSVAEEVRYQVRRLMYHPSIVIWAGNNENELGLVRGWFGGDRPRYQYRKDYLDLYVTTIGRNVTKEDSSRPYVTSSPSNGAKTKQDGWISSNPDSWNYGDIHFYDYVSDLWKDFNIPIPRFASEYGVQSWCSYSSLLPLMDAKDLKYWSNFTEHRQHHIGGQVEMEAEILQHFDIPASSKKFRPKVFQDIIYLTQINQAMSIRFETESYRRHQSEAVNGNGLTMGALYWQLNDIWQAPTWSSLEYDGKWKMLHYYSTKFFASVLISPYIANEKTLHVNMVVDEIPIKEHRQPKGNLQLIPIKNSKTKSVLTGTVLVKLYNWQNRTPVKNWSQKYTLNQTSEVVLKVLLSEIKGNKKCPQLSSCFLHFSTEKGESGPTSWLPLGRFKQDGNIPLAKIKIMKVSETKGKNDTFNIDLSSTNIAPFVWLEAVGVLGRFSDNGFLMLNPNRTIEFYAWQNVTVPKLKSSLTVKSLMDVYAKK
ncbi:beta-mannosidase-like [Argonauta hians]